MKREDRKSAVREMKESQNEGEKLRLSPSVGRLTIKSP